MQVSVETTSALERRMKVELPEERVASEVENRLKSIARTARMDGFRAGKVPFSVVKKRYQGQVLQEVAGELIQSSFYDAVTQENLFPVGQPAIEPIPSDEGKGLVYQATFEVYPEITVAPLDAVEIEKPVVTISEEDVDNMIAKVRKQRSEWVAVDRAAEKGDRVTIDFKGSIDGEEFAGGSAEKLPVELGGGRMISGFEDQLIGVKADETPTLDLSFPEDYHSKELAGKAVQFAVTVHSVEMSQLPDIDEEFIKSLGIEEGGEAELREQILKSMQIELDNGLRNKLKTEVSDKLLAANKVDVPKAMITQDLESSAQRMNTTIDKLNEAQIEKMTEMAEKRVATGLLFSEIVKANNLTVPAERVRAEIEKTASTYDDPQQVIDWYYSDKKNLSEVEGVVLEDMIIDFILDSAKVNEVQSSFEEVVKV